MSEVIRKVNVNIRDLSRDTKLCTTQSIMSEGNNTVADMFEAASTGSLQRIADSLEQLIPLAERIVAATEDKTPRSLETQKIIIKLRARLKAAGLDDSTTSDNRGKRKR